MFAAPIAFMLAARQTVTSTRRPSTGRSRGTGTRRWPMVVRRSAAMAAAVVAGLVLAACGGDDGDDTEAGSEESDQAVDDAGGGDFCTDLEAIVDGGVEIMGAVFGEDPDALAGVIDEAAERYPEMAASVRASAPDELSADVATVSEATTAFIEALADADLSSPEAAAAAMEDAPAMGPEVEEASDRIAEYARTECGFDPDEADEALDDVAFPSSPEPPDACAFVDPQVVATAAGIEVNVADEDGGADVDLGIYATKGCSYGNGSMSISTITYAGGLDEVVQSFADSAEDNGGRVVTDADLGSLPASTVLTEVQGYLLITVFEAPTAFSVGFEGNDDPAALVAAAEAVVAATT
jgi:hypothetical protein